MRGQQTRSVPYPQLSSWPWEGALWGMKKCHGEVPLLRCSRRGQRHVRMCPRAGEQANQHQPPFHAISCTLTRLGIPHQVESRGTLHGGQEPELGHRRQDRRSSERCKPGILSQSYPSGRRPRTIGRQPRRLASAGSRYGNR